MYHSRQRRIHDPANKVLHTTANHSGVPRGEEREEGKRASQLRVPPLLALTDWKEVSNLERKVPAGKKSPSRKGKLHQERSLHPGRKNSGRREVPLWKGKFRQERSLHLGKKLSAGKPHLGKESSAEKPPPGKEQAAAKPLAWEGHKQLHNPSLGKKII